MLERPTVSIVIPVYNAAQTIARCLDSVLSQSYEALEIIAVDDGSRDDSLARLHAYADADSRVRVFSQPNGGVSSARNCALRHVTGKYIRFVDSDDTLPPTSVEQMVEAVETQGCELCIARYYEVLPNARQTRGFLKNDMVLSQRALLDKLSKRANSFYYGVLWNKLFRADLIARHLIRFDSSLPWGEDFAFNMLYMRYVRFAAILSEPVYDYIRSFNGLALLTARQCLAHPLYGIRVKIKLRNCFRQLYIDTGMYEDYHREVDAYLFRVTINN